MSLKESRYKLTLKVVSERQANKHNSVTLCKIYINVGMDVDVYLWWTCSLPYEQSLRKYKTKRDVNNLHWYKKLHNFMISMFLRQHFN